MTAWTPLLDRLEERLRRISDQALSGASGGSGASGAAVDVGPAPQVSDRPAEQPTEAELVRLHALGAAHDQLDARLRNRRSQLQQAERYDLQTGS
ncbi:MAG: hypothetical protein QOJ32_823 [Frankiaceae bacterium]|nr:hypothetical protein [Frankiaceae bacterium]